MELISGDWRTTIRSLSPWLGPLSVLSSSSFLLSSFTINGITDPSNWRPVKIIRKDSRSQLVTAVLVASQRRIDAVQRVPFQPEQHKHYVPRAPNESVRWASIIVNSLEKMIFWALPRMSCSVDCLEELVHIVEVARLPLLGPGVEREHVGLTRVKEKVKRKVQQYTY